MPHTLNEKKYRFNLWRKSIRTRNRLPTNNEYSTEHDVNGIGEILNTAKSLTAPSKVEEPRKIVSEYSLVTSRRCNVLCENDAVTDYSSTFARLKHFKRLKKGYYNICRRHVWTICPERFYRPFYTSVESVNLYLPVVLNALPNKTTGSHILASNKVVVDYTRIVAVFVDFETANTRKCIDISIAAGYRRSVVLWTLLFYSAVPDGKIETIRWFANRIWRRRL